MHTAIFVPGLGDYNKNLPFLEKLWRKEGIDFHIHFAPWQKKEESFEKKLTRLVKKIDELSRNGQKISLIGTSAGGSLVINAYAQRKTKIHRLITISARLIKGTHVFPSLFLAAHGHTAFYDSVLSCEKILPSLTVADKQKMMTTQSLFWDEIVPLSTMNIPGVQRLKIAMPLHRYSIAAAMILNRKKLIAFMQH